MKALVCLVCLAASALSQPKAAEVEGRWVNASPGTAAITRLYISYSKSGLQLNAFVRCQPSDCELPQTALQAREQHFEATLEQPFISTRLQLRPLPEEKLSVELTRGTQSPLNLVFEREAPGTYIPSDAKTLNLLKNVALRYQKLGNAFFEYDFTMLTLSKDNTNRLAYSEKIWISADDRLRVEKRYLNPAHDSDTVIDANSTYTYSPATKEYRRVPRRLNAVMNTMLGVITTIDKISRSPGDAGEESIAGHPCRKILLRTMDGGQHEVWIDPTSNLVWRWTSFIVDSGGIQNASYIHTLSFRTAAVEQQHQEAIFEFDAASFKFRSGPDPLPRQPKDWIGQSAPELTLSTLDGKPASLSQLRGKPVLLYFWASWGAHCRTSMPALERHFRQATPTKDLVIVPINAEDPEVQKSFLAANGLTLSGWVDSRETAANAFGVYLLPSYILISPAGKVLAYKTGALDEAGLSELLSQ